jgi:chromosome segregation ATPase
MSDTTPETPTAFETPWERAARERDTLATQLAQAQGERDKLAELYKDSGEDMECYAEKLEKAQEELTAARAECERLREIVSACVGSLGSGKVSKDASMEFMGQVPMEIHMVVKSLRAENAELRRCEPVIAGLRVDLARAYEMNDELRAALAKPQSST